MKTRLAVLLAASVALSPLVAQAADAPAKTDKAAPKWDVSAPPGAPMRQVRIDVDEGTWMDLDVSPDGRTIAFNLLGDIYVMPVGGGAPKRIAEGLAWEVQPRFSPDGQWLASGGYDNTIKLWRAADGSLLRTITAGAGNLNVTKLAFSADSQTLFSLSYNGACCVLNPADGSLRRLITNSFGVNFSAISPDGTLVACASGGGAIPLVPSAPRAQLPPPGRSAALCGIPPRLPRAAPCADTASRGSRGTDAGFLQQHQPAGRSLGLPLEYPGHPRGV